MTTFPYRFRATEGLYAGTTFVYPSRHLVITYDTANPLTYFQTPVWMPGGDIQWSSAHSMDGDSYRRFEAIPEGDGT